ncbi:FMN-dependent NADH-azoreductase [Aliidiomarina maris]|uniref:FMN dependent NADH:quinone oxidoreductase n=1 Tax=Aliidiomarina maris TaxID=531312 RepID=A0A327WYW7_9GAMM|nr:NAD(P)H-dependent oxidoreductase [Aliidiomarina maris]RAJ98389.1 FMN-dependent NADH-azoreductase [Aliidiomarina maris]RUO24795.1 FMN-dependent NADH-azoreductase [Aliidiomarina maris]
MKILHVTAGIFGDNSVSTQLSNKLVERLSKGRDDVSVVVRDVAATAISHLDAEVLMAASTAEGDRSPRQVEELALTETLLEEIFAADVLVIGAPMYNFTIPSQLKAWFDRIAQAGRTFRYTENGPEGLLTDKKAYVASARGGFYSEGEMAALDHQESYVTTILGFVGIKNVTVVRAEGVNISDSQREESIQAASANIDALALS